MIKKASFLLGKWFCLHEVYASNFFEYILKEEFTVLFLAGSLLFIRINLLEAVRAPRFHPTTSTIIPAVPLAAFSAGNAVKQVKNVIHEN